MIEQDTVRLLRECDAGVKMGVASIGEVLPYVSSPELEKCLSDCKTRHEMLGDELNTVLDTYGDDGKDPNPVAKGMSWLKSNVMLTVNGSDGAIADLITDGCNMGVKSLNKYLNQYKAADETSKNLAKHLIRLEEGLADDVRRFL